MRSLCGAAALLRRGYLTATPVAAVEQRFWGVLIKSFYVSEEIPGAKTVEAFWCDELGAWRGVAGYVERRLFLRALARLFKSLHDNGVYHNDLKSANILVVGGRAASETMFGLIDLQGLRECFFVSARRRIKNLAQLNRSLGVHLTRSERLFFLNAYGDYRLLDRRARRALVSGILEQTDRQISREKLRHHAVEKYPCLETAS
jgi:serine/threonine protein kinase